MSESLKQDLLNLLFNTVFIVIPWGVFCYFIVKTIGEIVSFPKVSLPRSATEEQVREYISKKMNVSSEIIYLSREHGFGDWQVVLYYNTLDCKYKTLVITDRMVLKYFDDNLESSKEFFKIK